jgi:putative acetyltransferase
VIRPCGPEDIERLMALWLPSTIAAHPFVAEKYWHESAALVRENYLPRAQSWACWHNDEIVGFISVLDEQFIGALFVDRAAALPPAQPGGVSAEPASLRVLPQARFSGDATPV